MSKIVLISLILTFFCPSCKQTSNSPNTISSSVLDEVRAQKELVIGYVLYPPYIQKDVTTGQLGGFSIDIILHIAKEMNAKPVFIESSWNTFISDTKIRKFQVFVGPIFHTIPRLMEVDFPEPYGYFSAIAGLAKKDDDRFKDISDLNKEEIVISVPQAWTVHDYAQRNLSKAKIKTFKQDSASMVFADLLGGNCDVALADATTVQQYLENNPNQNVRPLFLEKPISFVQAGFMIRKGDPTWLEFLSGSMRVMRTEGTIRGIANRYNLYSFEENINYVRQ